jgi:hypothetical protein
MLLLQEKQRGEARKPSKQNYSFGYREELVAKALSHSFSFLMSATLDTIALRPTSMTVKRLK